MLWSEHCGYKHSALLLRSLPSQGERVLQGPGENAGVVDVGGGLAVAFKVESHNHPTAVEPFQGAATGVGGILRDVVAMGARPIALLDGLRFGAPDWHFRRAVAGVGHYGNCTGIPTVGGETVFDEAYAANPLVNAMCVGLLPAERVLRARARGAGNLVVLYGALTGRDGIGGASVLASQDLEGSHEKRPSVQIGDPFRGKALIEVSLDLVERELVAGLQDCGAAGLASSLAEMASDGAGVEVHLDRVPLREPDLEPWEIMISESQERMVAVVEPGRLDEVEAACTRWELPCTVIGEVTDERPAARAARRRRRRRDPGAPAHRRDAALRARARGAPGARRLRRRIPPTGSPKTWVFEQYDHLVGSRTVRRPGLDAAVLLLEGSRGLAVSLDGPPLGERDPWRAGWAAVMDAALNVACAGGEPIALTDCLNFGNPERPEIAWELASAIDGITAAANELGDPCRLRERVALQRDRRPADPADTGRRMRRPRRGRPPDSVALARRRPRLPAARRGRSVGALRLAARPPLHACARHRRRRRRARPPAGGGVERRRDRAHVPRGPGRDRDTGAPGTTSRSRGRT